jgi:hypothetical protein
MLKMLSATLVALSVVASPVVALPMVPDAAPADPGAGLVIQVASKAYRRSATAACRRQYGQRFAYVGYPKRGGYVCYFRKSNKTLTKQAARKCRKQGYRLDKVVSIKIKGRQSITTYRCKRR